MLTEKSFRRLEQSIQQTEENPLYGAFNQLPDKAMLSYLDLDNRVICVRIDAVYDLPTNTYDGYWLEYDFTINEWGTPNGLTWGENYCRIVGVIDPSGNPDDYRLQSQDTAPYTYVYYRALLAAYDEANDIIYYAVFTDQNASELNRGVINLHDQKLGQGTKEVDYLVTNGELSTDLIQIQREPTAGEVSGDDNIPVLRAFNNFGSVLNDILEVEYNATTGPYLHQRVLINDAKKYPTNVDYPTQRNIPLIVGDDDSGLGFPANQWSYAAAFQGKIGLSRTAYFDEMYSSFNVTAAATGYDMPSGIFQGSSWAFNDNSDLLDPLYARVGIGIDGYGDSTFAADIDYYSINGTKGLTGTLLPGATALGGLIDYLGTGAYLTLADFDQGTWPGVGGPLQLYRGPEASIPVLADGQPGFTTDTNKLFIGYGGVNYEIGTLSGTAGGDLSGTYPNPDVIGLQGDPLVGPNINGFIKRDITNAFWESVAYGSTANTVCEGDDSRLSDDRIPTGPAGGDLGLTYPNPEVLGLQGDVLPLMGADGFIKRDVTNTFWEQVPYGSTANTVCEGTDARLSDSRNPIGTAGGDLTGSYPNPDVAGLIGDPLAATTGDGFIKRDVTDTSWEMVPYGTGANQVCEGNDSRLSDDRTPLVHATTHEPTGSDEIDWAGLIHQIGLDASKPAASGGNEGCYYTSTDINGGTTYRSNGVSWVAIASGVNTVGTVTSVGLSTNASWFSVTGTPVTSSGTLAIDLTTGLAANKILATPDGATGTVALRSMVLADVPSSDLIGMGAIGTLPAAGNEGAIFLTTNTPYVYRDNGVTWDIWYDGTLVGSPGDYAFTWVNQDGATETYTNDNNYLYHAARASVVSLNVRKRVVPTVPYAGIIVGVQPLFNPVYYSYICIGWRESSSGKLVSLSASPYDGTYNYFTYMTWNSATSIATTTNLVSNIGTPTHRFWVKLVDDNTNRKIYLSSDRFNWALVHTVARTTFLTADEWFYGIVAYNQDIGVSIFDVEEIP